MKKTAILVFILALLQVSIKAQNLSESQVTELMNASFVQNKAGNYQEALAGFLVVGQNTIKQRTELERQVYVCSQTMAVMCYESLGRYEEGFRLSEDLLERRITESEKKDLQHLYVVNGYFFATSYMHSDTRRYADARMIFSQILPFADANMKNRILPKIPLSWYFEGMFCQLQQKYNEALPCLQEARKGFHELHDIENEMDAVRQMGDVKEALFDTFGALGLYHEAEVLARLGDYEEDLLKILDKQSFLCKLIGDSERLYQLTLQIDSLVAVANNEKVKINYYYIWGDEAKEQGYYNLAEQWYLKNEKFVNQLKNENDWAVKYIYYKKLRDLYTKTGNFDEALKYARLSMTEFQKGLEKTDANYYMPYRNIADIYRRKGDSIRCFQCIDTLFFSLKRYEEPREILPLFTTRAICFSSFKKYEQALSDYKTADSIIIARYGENDENRTVLFPLMGGVEHRLGHYEESERLYRLYADRTKIRHGDNSRDHIDALYYLANAEGFAGHIEAACDDYSTAAGKMKQQTRDRLPYMASAERESYWKSSSELFQRMTSFALMAEQYQTVFTKDCYEGLLLMKSFLLATERSTYDLLKDKGTSEDQYDYATIASMRAKIKDWERDYSSNADSILTLTSKANAIEQRLVNRCRGYGDATAFMNIDYQDIKDRLGDGDILIDFTDFLSETRGRIYAAYLIDRKQEFPLLKRLFAESKIDSLQIPYPHFFYKSSYAKDFYRLLWEPFEKYVKEGAIVYYIPSQRLFQIALENIPTKDGSLLGQHYHFVRLSSARELATYETSLNIDHSSATPDAVLYGGLLYDLDANEMESEARKYDIAPQLALRGDILRGDSLFKELPGTKKEVAVIGKVLKSHRLSVTPYTGKLGTEESFLNMSGRSPMILHLATHGFYYTPAEAQEYDYLRGYSDAMLLSGLVLSGGNAAWRGRKLPEGVLGGILTAANIARLDLGNTRLAVLSACQSGNGNVTAEGLFGLQRAFKKAGVSTIVMSLWEVEDNVGAEFMILFYENLADKDNHWDKRAAFEKTKKAIRDKYHDPYYWAGFIMLD